MRGVDKDFVRAVQVETIMFVKDNGDQPDGFSVKAQDENFEYEFTFRNNGWIVTQIKQGARVIYKEGEAI